MHKNYIESAEKLKYVSHNILNLIVNADKDAFEDKNAYRLLENIHISIQSTIKDVGYYSRLTKEGYLSEIPNGRYELDGIELTSGMPLEIYSEGFEEWYSR